VIPCNVRSLRLSDLRLEKVQGRWIWRVILRKHLLRRELLRGQKTDCQTQEKGLGLTLRITREFAGCGFVSISMVSSVGGELWQSLES